MKKNDLDEFGFRRIDHDFIFIASSSDVLPERELIERAMEDELDSLGEAVKVYSYDTANDGTVLDQRTSMQRSIPRPSSKHCKGIVYVLGERFGSPLENTQDRKPGSYREQLGKNTSWCEDADYPVVLDWPADPEERLRLLSGGGYPMTGGVFEFLAATGCVEDDQQLGKPALFVLLADQPLTLGGGEIALNQNRWLNTKTSNMSRPERQKWEREVFDPEVTAVHNFLKALVKNGIDQNPTLDYEKLTNTATQFVRRDIFQLSVDYQNPYQELRYYDAHDPHFYGRDAFVEAVVRDVKDQLRDPARKASSYVYGPSGSGKSSVLRAGIFRALQDPRERGGYFCVAIRPDMFKDNAGADMDVLATLLDQIAASGGPSLPGEVNRTIASAAANAPEEAAQAILSALKDQSAAPKAFILALDQFEEIVDELSAPRRGEYWQPLLRFVECLSNDPMFGLLFTLESSRKDQFEALTLSDPFKTAEGKELSDAGDAFIDEIIRRPFARTHYYLASDVVKELTQNFSTLRDKDSHTGRNSVLPLLALKLHDLWEFVSINFERKDDTDISSADMVPDEDRITLSDLTSKGWDAGFATILNDLATKAWRRAKIGDTTDGNLDGLLQPLVGVQSGNVQLTVTQRNAPYINEKRVIESFRAHRLLVDVGNGLVRLVHQAVLDHWKTAERWVTDNREFLNIEADTRIEAKKWENDRKPSIRIRGKNLEEKIEFAVLILGKYLRLWSFEDSNLNADDALLREFCICVFQKSKTPRKPVTGQPKLRGSHVGLAASYGLTTLLKTFQKIDSQSVSEIVSANEDAAPPLGQAAWAHLDAVEFILANSSDVIGRSRRSWPAVAAAIQRGRTDIFSAMMQTAKTCVNGKGLEELLICPGNATLAHLAAQFDQVDILKELIEHYGFDPNAMSENGWTPLHYSCFRDSLKTFNYLRTVTSLEATTANSLDTCLHIAAANDAKQILDQILRLPQGRNIRNAKNKYGSTALHFAALKCNADCVTALVKAGLDVNAGETTPLHMLLGNVPGATVNRFKNPSDESYDLDRALDTLKALLSAKDIDPNVPNEHDRTPLGVVAGVRPLLLELLRHPGVDLTLPVGPDTTPGILIAAREGIWNVVEAYLDEHGLPESSQADSGGNTFLHHITGSRSPSNKFAAYIGSASEEQINARNKRGRTALNRAVTNRRWPLAMALLETGLTKLHATDNALNWELYNAIHHEAPEDVMIKITDTLGDDGLAKADAVGWTILHHFAATGQRDFMERLSKSVDLAPLWSLPDKLGRTPIDLAATTLDEFLPADSAPVKWPDPITWETGLAWKPVSENRAKIALSALDMSEEDASSLTITQAALPFYPKKAIVRASYPSNGKVRPTYYFLASGQKLSRLEGTSPPIHEFNHKYLKLQTVDDARRYLHYFCFFVRGEEGPFYILEDASAPTVSSDLSAEDRSLLRDHATPAWLRGEFEDGFRYLAKVYYSNALFGAHFRVLKTGMIEMEDDTPVTADLSGTVEMPLK